MLNVNQYICRYNINPLGIADHLTTSTIPKLNMIEARIRVERGSNLPKVYHLTGNGPCNSKVVPEIYLQVTCILIIMHTYSKHSNEDYHT
jgi:hypothetical protein